MEQGRFFNRSEKANCVQLQVAIPLEQGRFFNGIFSLAAQRSTSQSLWSRDGFSIKVFSTFPEMKEGRNPFGAGTVFQWLSCSLSWRSTSRNPFGAGTVFQYLKPDRIGQRRSRNPFGAGTVFQLRQIEQAEALMRRNPFGAGTVFQ